MYVLVWYKATIPVTTVDVYQFVLSTCYEDARRSRARTLSYRWAVSGTPETHYGDIKAVSFKEKIHGNSSKSGNKTLSVSRAESVLCYFCGKNNHSNADCRTRFSEFTKNQNRPNVGSEAQRRGQGLDPKLQRAERTDEQGWTIVWSFLFSFQDKQTV